MGSNTRDPARTLPDGSPLKNRLLLALSAGLYEDVAHDLDLKTVALGEVLYGDGAQIKHVYFPNGGVYSVTNQMRNGTLLEVATVGLEGMLGCGVFLGDPIATGQTLLQVPDGPLPRMTARHFLRHTAGAGPLRTLVMKYVQATFLQVTQCTACNALHRLEHRCCRWLLETHDRVEGDEFLLKQEFLAIMLGASRPTVSLVMGSLQKAGLLTTRYGTIRILDRKKLERASCECYQAIRSHHKRLGLV
jgi:CRP-like cAMP-binding protein